MKVAQNDETNPDMQSVRPPHTPNLSNLQLSPSGSSARKHETRMFSSACYPVMHLLAMYLLFLPPLLFGRPRGDADAPVVDYVTDDPSFLSEQRQAPPPWSPDIAYSSLYCLH